MRAECIADKSVACVLKFHRKLGPAWRSMLEASGASAAAGAGAEAASSNENPAGDASNLVNTDDEELAFTNF